MESMEQTTIAYDKENEEKFQNLVTKYPTRQAAVLPALWLAQDQWGYLTPEIMDYVAGRLEQPPVSVYAVVEFYTMFHTRPVGTHHIQMCRTLSCTMRGCEDLTAFVERRLGIKPGETTEDNKFSFEMVECLGSCGTAPMMRMDDRYFEDLSEDKLERIIAACEEGKSPAEI